MSSRFNNSVISYVVRGGAGMLARAMLALALAASAFAQGLNSPPPATAKPPGLEHVGIEQRLNAQLPLDLTFRDEGGKTVRLGDYFGKKPVILNFVYYRCPMLCPELLIGLESALKVVKFDAGKEFEVVTVSFDPRDTPEVATAKKADILSRYKRPGAETGWHFLTGSQESIAALTNAAGFDYQFDPKTGQFAHSTAIMVVTPTGKLAQYYYGVDFPPNDLRLALIQASSNKIGTLTDAVILYCFHYDPVAGRYSAVISRIIKLSGGLTILLIGTVLLVLFRRGPDHEGRRESSSH